MRFCDQCDSVMSKNTTPAGAILFTCKCQWAVLGGKDDTLMPEEYFENSESNEKHEVFIENSPFDPAGNIVMRDCPNCSLNFLTMIRVGITETTMYSCTCGYSATQDEYMRK